MAKQRDRIQMSPDEIRAFLAECKSMIVASLAPDGAPHLTVLWFAVGEDGSYLFETYGKSQKVLNLRRDPRISVLWEKGSAYQELRGVSVTGRAEIIDSGPRLKSLMSMVARRNHPEMDEQTLDLQAERMIEKRGAQRPQARPHAPSSGRSR